MNYRNNWYWESGEQTKFKNPKIQIRQLTQNEILKMHNVIGQMNTLGVKKIK